MTSLINPETQPQYKRGYEAYKEGITKNPFEHASMRMNSHKIYWRMGWEAAKEEDRSNKGEI